MVCPTYTYIAVSTSTCVRGYIQPRNRDRMDIVPRRRRDMRREITRGSETRRGEPLDSMPPTGGCKARAILITRNHNADAAAYEIRIKARVRVSCVRACACACVRAGGRACGRAARSRPPMKPTAAAAKAARANILRLRPGRAVAACSGHRGRHAKPRRKATAALRERDSGRARARTTDLSSARASQRPISSKASPSAPLAQKITCAIAVHRLH